MGEETQKTWQQLMAENGNIVTNEVYRLMCEAVAPAQIPDWIIGLSESKLATTPYTINGAFWIKDSK